MKSLIKIIVFLFVFSPLKGIEEVEKEFTEIYINGTWGWNLDGIPHSGGGSTLFAARDYITILQRFIKEKNIKSIVDAGCGDWEFSKHIDFSGVNYIGIDVVKFLIERNIKQFGAPNISFIHGDIIDAELPPADLLICKDVLQHLSEEYIQRFMTQLKKYKYCLITNGAVFDWKKILAPLNPVLVCSYYGDQVKDIVLIENQELFFN